MVRVRRGSVKWLGYDGKDADQRISAGYAQEAEV